MSSARSHHRPPVQRVIRTAKQGSARDAIGPITPGCEVLVLTFGQFSLIDAVVELLRQTGPADVILSTWTAAAADLTTAAALIETAAITSLKLIVDRSFLTRQPEYCRKMRELFGDACIRTMRSHAKFCVIRNAQWNLACRTSMNLNTNPRLEQIEISDDVGLADFLSTLAADLWAEQPAGTFDGEMPELPSLPNVERPGKVTGVGSVTIG